MTIYYEAYEPGLKTWLYGHVTTNPTDTAYQAMSEAQFMVEADYDEFSLSLTPIMRRS